MRSFLARILLLSLLYSFAASTPLQAATEQRVALVIGNGSYASSPLANPVHDATDMATSLKRLGFKVTLKKNAHLQDMEEAIRDFGDSLRGGVVGLFFYAGHGVQIAGKNYLIPIGAKIKRETDVKYQAVDAEMILDEMANAGNSMNIVILDACRDNPFGRSFRTASRGLAIISSAPKGSYITYSTSPGKVAADGSGRNSPYTKALLTHMAVPGLPIEEVFKKVRQELGKKTKGQQIPWELSSLEGNFFFTPPKGQGTTARVKVETESPAADYEAERTRLEEERKKLEQEKELLEQRKALEEEQRRLQEERKRIEEGKKKLAYVPTQETRFIQRLNARVTEIKFFEGGYTPPAKEQREYRRNFPKNATRYVNWEVNLAFPAPGRRIDFKIEHIWFGPHGNEIFRAHWDSYVLADWTGSWHNHGYGWNNVSPSTWQAGMYRVDFYVDGDKIASENFTIY